MGWRMIIRNLIKMSFAQKSIATIRQHEQFKKRRKSLFGVKLSNIAVYAGIFLLVVSMIYVGYDQPQKTSAVSNASANSPVGVIAQPSVDDVVAANVAAGVAQTINLPVAASVSNLAISVETMALIMSSESSIASKPTIFESVVESKKVKNYTVVEGDNINLISEKFKISEQTLRWANKLKESDEVSVGDVLKILPVNGVLYTIKGTDTIESIAEKYKVDSTRFTTYNDLEVSGLVANNNIVLPDGILPENERPDYIAPVINYYYASGTGFGGNTWFMRYGTGPCPGYSYGNCTCYAYARRVELGLPVGSNGGNAATWAIVASTPVDKPAPSGRGNGWGLIVNNTPSVGAIMQNSGDYRRGDYWGHVAIVESVAENGDITISEMNASVPGGGYNKVSGRTISAGDASQYNFIH